MTEKINDRELYMKGIDVSYYYEGYSEYRVEGFVSVATDDMEIIHSPLEQTYSAEGRTLCIQIYRSADSLSGGGG